MAGVKISELPLATILNDSDQLLLVQGDSSRRILASNFVKPKDINLSLSAISTQIQTISSQTINVADGPVVDLSYNNRTRTLSADIGLVPVNKGGTGQTNFLNNSILIGLPTGGLEQRQLSASTGITIAKIDNEAGNYINIINSSPHRSTDLSNTSNANSITIQSSTGSNTTIGPATNSLAGIMTNTDKFQLTTLWETLCADVPLQCREQPALTGVKQALLSALYIAPSFTSFQINNTNSRILEVGETLFNTQLNWSVNKKDSNSILNYTLTLPNQTTVTRTPPLSSYVDSNLYRVATIPGNATSQTFVWRISAIDWVGASAMSTLSATWMHRIYFGATSQQNPTTTQILEGTQGDILATSKTNLAEQIVVTNNQYAFVAYPVRFGDLIQFKINGLNNTDVTRTTINNFRNNAGGLADYYVYRTNNLLFSTYTIQII